VRSASSSPAKLNAMRGPVRFLIPEGRRLGHRPTGPALPRPRGATACSFDTIERGFRSGVRSRRPARLPQHLNDEAFAAALVAAWREVSRPVPARRA
jgi:uncharacterized protein (UPF0261 family)